MKYHNIRRPKSLEVAAKHFTVENMMIDNIPGGMLTWEDAGERWRGVATRLVRTHHMEEMIEYAKTLAYMIRR